ncbi:MAG: PadR family transcriptional regulator [Candidatus Bathyarchaeia archaeon]|jgi:DNA-binding PadR family transcriptional regulator
MVDVVCAFQRGLDKPLILWLISKGPVHGYEINNEVKRLTGRRLKPATLYPLLNKLEDDGFLASELTEKGRRKLRCYRLTEKGKKCLAKMSEFFKLPLRRIIADLLGEQD